MDLKCDYFDKLPKCYQNVVMELMANLAAKTVEEKRKLFEDFQKHYTLIPPLWSCWKEIDRGKIYGIDFKTVNGFLCSKFVKEESILPSSPPNAFINVMCRRELEDLVTPDRGNTKLKWREDDLLPYLLYPHTQLKQAYNYFDEACSDDKESIKTNIEIILGDHSYCVELWNKCIEYFENNSPSKFLLSLYTRYCGIFLDDEKAIAKRNEIKIEKVEEKRLELSGSSTFSWPKPFHLIFKDPTIFNNVKFQCMPFPKPIRNYIYEKANSKIATKLKNSAKHFVRVFPHNIIRRLEIVNHSPEVRNYGIKIPDNIMKQLPNNIWLTNALIFNFLGGNIFPILTQKIVRCDLKYIRIEGEKILLADVKFLTKSKNVEVFDFHECPIMDEDDIPIPLEDIIPLVLKVYYFKLTPCHVTTKTAKKILNLQLQNKLNYYEMSKIDNLLDTVSFLEFFKKNLSPCAFVELNWNEELVEATDDLLWPNLEELMKIWEPRHEKPYICLNQTID